LLAFADVLFNPFLLSALIYLLGGETWKIAMPLVISGASWSLSVPIRSILSRISPPGRYLATVSGVIRTAAAVLLAWLGYFADDVEPTRLIDLLLICFTAYLIASAFNLATLRGLIAASTPAIRAPSLFRLQRVLAGISSVAGGVVAIYSLRSNELEFHKNFGVLFLLGAIAVGAATWFQFMTTVAATRATVPVSGPRGGIWNALTNPGVRRLLGFRFLIGLSALADPFLIVFGIEELRFSPFYIAAAIATYAGGQLVSALIAPRWSEHRGPRGILLTGSVFRLIAIVLAVTIPPLSRTSLYADRFDTNWQATLAFVGLFALLGISAYLQGIGSQRYISDVVPAGGRVATISLANVVLALTAASPLLGAYLIEQYDLDTLLIVATVLAFVGFASGGFLFDPSPRIIRQQGTWRRRRAVRRAA
jgi:hypothetical protein